MHLSKLQSSWSSTSAGGCPGSCTTFANSCPFGQYLSNCGNLSAGACTDCMNSLPTGDEWASNGGTSSIGCMYSSCSLSCNTGPQYVTGCSLTPPNPICASCTNTQTANANYYLPGTSYSLSCPLATYTSTCSVGQYLQNCGPPRATRARARLAPIKIKQLDHPLNPLVAREQLEIGLAREPGDLGEA